jgi:solute carrier family 35 protein E1
VQVSFAWSGFNNAMISNLGMVLRNIYSKKSLVDFKVRGCGDTRRRNCCSTDVSPIHLTSQNTQQWPTMTLLCCLRVQHIDGINLFGLISIVSLVYCAPAAFFMEGGQWAAAWQAAADKLGLQAFVQLLALSGVFYHLYNQVRGRARWHACMCSGPTWCWRLLHHTATLLW